MSEKKKKLDFSNLLKNKLEERVLNHFEAVAEAFSGETADSIEAQTQLLAHSFDSIIKIYKDGGYINARGYKTALSPRDILFLQQAIENAIRLRSELLMLPLGVSNSTEFLKASNSLPSDVNDPKNSGLNEPPPLAAIDSEKDETSVDVEPESPVEEQAEEQEVLGIPLKTVDS